MKARPILFSAPMVLALLNGSKTQTRRVVKPQPEKVNGCWRWGSPRYDNGLGAKEFHTQVISRSIREAWAAACPYGVPSDLLYVREGMRYSEEHDNWYYRADDSGVGTSLFMRLEGHTDAKRINSIHMPRWASRLTLRITGVRAQRVQDISEGDAECEGVEPATPPEATGATYRAAFRNLWNDINGPAAWGRNPWVWAITFDVLERNVDDVLREAA